MTVPFKVGELVRVRECCSFLQVRGNKAEVVGPTIVPDISGGMSRIKLLEGVRTGDTLTVFWDSITPVSPLEQLAECAGEDK